MIGRHAGIVEGRPFVLRLGQPGVPSPAQVVQGHGYWEIDYADLVYPWRPATLEDEKDLPRLLHDAATYLRGAAERAP